MRRNTGRILLVDDDLDFLRLSGNFLRDKGHEVIEVRDPLGLAPRLSETPPDLIIMDIQMPIGGAEFAQKMIDQEPRFSAVPILICSSLSLRQMKDLFPETPTRRHIHKPVDFKEFDRLIQALLTPSRNAS